MELQRVEKSIINDCIKESLEKYEPLKSLQREFWNRSQDMNKTEVSRANNQLVAQSIEQFLFNINKEIKRLKNNVGIYEEE